MSPEVPLDTKSLLNLLWDGSSFGLILTNPNGEILKVNDTYMQIYGINKDLIGESFLIVYPEEIKEEAQKHYDTIFRSNNPTSQYSGNYKTLNGEEKILEIKTFFLTENQERASMLTVVEDVTQQKLAALEIKNAKEKIEEADRLKAAFLANISHEIRTPMNGIIGFSSMLLDPNLTEEKRSQFVELIISSSNKLLELIGDIIDLSMIEAHRVEINNSEFYLNDLMDGLFSYFITTAKSKDIRFSFQPGLPMTDSKISTDETKLKQILTNLISNALKFTHEGAVEFGYTITKKDIQFLVRDTGIGIDPRFYKTIFENFRQADDSNTRQYGGSGLGLSISKSFIELLGGRIWVQSKINEGSSFYFTIPYHPVEAPELTENIKEGLSIPDWTHKTILIAEDEMVNYIYLSEVLAETKVCLLLAKNGLEAVNFIRADHTIDLILMDIKMPEMNGYEAAKIIKQIRPAIPIIAQTAYAMAGDREIALSEGCDDYISKPVKKGELISILLKYIR
jgi:PAS domain S-box-containing protein